MRDLTHLPTNLDEHQPEAEAKDRPDPFEQNAPKPQNEPTPPEAIVKLWTFLKTNGNPGALQTVLAFLIFLATIAVAFIYARQLIEMRESNGISRKSFESAQRAWVGVINPTVKDVQYKESTFGIDGVLTLRNFGISPGLKVLPQVRLSDIDSIDGAAATICMTDKEWYQLQTADPRDSGKRVQGNTVFPSQEIPFPFTVGGGIPKLVRPGDPVWLMGCLTYTDQSQKIRHTRFCLFTGAPPPNTGGFPFQRCAMYEQAD
jgi:hypothetical protein